MWIAVSEAAEQSIYSREHIKYLVRTGKVEGRKTGGFWLVSLDSLREYEKRMAELGPQKFDPTRDDLTV